jgi:hypothetical protein
VPALWPGRVKLSQRLGRAAPRIATQIVPEAGLRGSYSSLTRGQFASEAGVRRREFACSEWERLARVPDALVAQMADDPHLVLGSVVCGTQPVYRAVKCLRPACLPVTSGRPPPLQPNIRHPAPLTQPNPIRL